MKQKNGSKMKMCGQINGNIICYIQNNKYKIHADADTKELKALLR